MELRMVLDEEKNVEVRNNFNIYGEGAYKSYSIG